MAGKIFINYRRNDSTGTAGRVHDRLAEAFGRKNLFMDVDHIPAGVDFVEYLKAQLAACDVFLAVIGPNWLDAKDDSGKRRLQDPNDFVAIEIAAALARNIRVIPVLIDGARMPPASELPESLKPLVRRQAIELRHAHFGRDAEALNEKIREASAPKALLPGQRLALPAAAVALFLIGLIGLNQFGVPMWMSRPLDAPPTQRSSAEEPSATAGSGVVRKSNETVQQGQAPPDAVEVQHRPEAAAPVPAVARSAPAPSAASARLASGGISDCPDDYVAFNADSPPLVCTCSAEATERGSASGMDVYAGLSEVCRAALHAGVIGKDGGQVTVISEPGRKFYPGVTRDGVKSGNWGGYKNSFRFAEAASARLASGGISDCPDDYVAFNADSPPLVCTCSAEATERGSASGMDVYAGLSEVCRAALHAGVIGKDGGQVTVISEPGRKFYPGVTRDGVRSGNWGGYKNSFRFAAVSATRTKKIAD